MGYREFVALLAACMSLNALTIDVMLPALPHIAQAFTLSGSNLQQAVIVVYLIGMGSSQLIYGPLADRFGRKPILLIGLALYVAASAAATLAASFEALLAARLLQGLGAGAPRVIALAMARDCHVGAPMARLMSLVMMVFSLVPIAAPSLGQLLLLVAPWRGIFALLLAGGAATLLWAMLRLRETLHPDLRRNIAPLATAQDMLAVFRDPDAARYTLAFAIMSGAIIAFITSCQQVFTETYGLDGRFALIFGGMATCLAIASFANSRLVGRFGIRPVCYGMLATHVVTSSLFLALGLAGMLPLWGFVVLQTILMAMYGFVSANFNVLALERMGHLAGSASSMIGFVSTVAGGILGFAVGQAFDGTTMPLAVGNLLFGVSAAALVATTRRDVPAQPDTLHPILGKSVPVDCQPAGGRKEK
jgi:DHA1 family bicyclomycin/chloramphenicol resistance-like MFS transporter